MADEKVVPISDEELAEVEGGDVGYRWFESDDDVIHCPECGRSDKIKYRYDWFKRVYCCEYCNKEFRDGESFHTTEGSF